MFETLTAKGFQVEFHSHAEAILRVDFPDAVAELDGKVKVPEQYRRCLLFVTSHVIGDAKVGRT